MRQYMIFTRIFLILSIINFARAAPALVREVHEVRVDVDVAEDGRAKRWEPWARFVTTSAADPSRVLTIPARGLQYYHPYGVYPPTDPASSESTDYSPPGSSESTDLPLPPALPSPNYSPNSWLADDSHLRSSSSPEYSPESESSPSSWSISYSPPSSWSKDHSEYSSPSSGSTDYSPPSSWPTDPPPPQPLPVTPTTGPLTGPHQSTDGHPPPSPGPPNPAESVSEPTSEDFLDKLLNGKIRRHISGPSAVNLALREV